MNFIGHIARRLLWTLPTLLIVAAMVFFLMRLIPGDPAQLILGDAGTPEQRPCRRASMRRGSRTARATPPSWRAPRCSCRSQLLARPAAARGGAQAGLGSGGGLRALQRRLARGRQLSRAAGGHAHAHRDGRAHAHGALVGHRDAAARIRDACPRQGSVGAPRVVAPRAAQRLFSKTAAKLAVDRVSLSIKPGEVVAVVGGSGSGKTTLGRALIGLLPLAGGDIRFKGQPLAQADAAQRREFRLACQMVFQDPYSSLNPRQRVAIARALIRRPALVMADEPVSALDMTIRKQVLSLLKRLQAQHGFACFFVSHNLAAVSAIADRIVVMHEGRLVDEGSVAQIFDAPQHHYTRALLQAAFVEPTMSASRAHDLVEAA